MVVKMMFEPVENACWSIKESLQQISHNGKVGEGEEQKHEMGLSLGRHSLTRHLMVEDLRHALQCSH